MLVNRASFSSLLPKLVDDDAHTKTSGAKWSTWTVGKVAPRSSIRYVIVLVVDHISLAIPDLHEASVGLQDHVPKD